jgi:hypothetical protein
MHYYIALSISDDFGIPTQNYWSIPASTHVGQTRLVKGIESINGTEAIIDPKVFIGKSFWYPISMMLNMRKNISEIDISEFSILGECEKDGNGIIFDPDNSYDIYKIWKNDNDRIGFLFSACPMHSVFCIQVEDKIKVIISPYSKDYFYMEDYQWLDFLDKMNDCISDIREAKINDLLGEHKESFINIIRKTKFLIKNDLINYKSRDFVSSVLSYYEKNGKITEKQTNALKKVVNDI